MKRLILCLVTLALAAAPCAAQISSGPLAAPSGPPPVPSGTSAVVPLNSWLFTAAETILQTGIPFGSPNGTYAGRRVVTRHEFAIATARVLMSSPTLPPEPRSNLVSDIALRLEASPPAVSALIALVHEFSPELSRLGQDVPKATARLDALQQQQRRDVHNGKIVLTAAQLSSPFANIPFGPTGWRQTWQYANIVQKVGVVIGVPTGDFSGSLPYLTRLQMAQSIARVFAQKPDRDVIDRLQRNPSALDAMGVLVTFYQPELTLLGMDATLYERRLNGQGGSREMMLPPAARPVPDVPASH